MNSSRFILVAVVALALVYGTRWCILRCYERGFVSTGRRDLEVQMLSATPPSDASPREEGASARVSPPARLPEIGSPRGR